MATKKEEGWNPLAFASENTEALVDIFKDRKDKYGLVPVIKVMTMGTGTYNTTARTVSGIDYSNVNLVDFMDLLNKTHTVTLKMV